MFAKISDGESQPTEKNTECVKTITESSKTYPNGGLYFDICVFIPFLLEEYTKNNTIRGLHVIYNYSCVVCIKYLKTVYKILQRTKCKILSTYFLSLR